MKIELFSFLNNLKGEKVGRDITCMADGGLSTSISDEYASKLDNAIPFWPDFGKSSATFFPFKFKTIRLLKACE